MKTLEIIATLATVPAVRHPHSKVFVVFKNISYPLPPAVIEAIMLVLHGLNSLILVGDDFLRSPLTPFYLLYLPIFLFFFYRVVLVFYFLCVSLLLKLGQDVSSSPSMEPTLDYFRWGIHLEHGTFDINATTADDT